MSSEQGNEPIRFPDGSGRELAALLETCPPGAVVELAPGRYPGPLAIRRAVVLRGAGDLTRIFANENASVVRVEAPADATVVLESLLLEDGLDEVGGGIDLREGNLRLHNVQIQRCAARAGGGAVHVSGGEIDAQLLRVHDVRGDRGGAIWVRGTGKLVLRDAQIADAEARLGGAFAFQDGAIVELESVSVRKSRATSSAGGQAIWLSGSAEGTPTVILRRVRLEDVPLGRPLVVEPTFLGEVRLSQCDMPRVVLDGPGVIDAGENHWR